SPDPPPWPPKAIPRSEQPGYRRRPFKRSKEALVPKKANKKKGKKTRLGLGSHLGENRGTRRVQPTLPPARADARAAPVKLSSIADEPGVYDDCVGTECADLTVVVVRPTRAMQAETVMTMPLAVEIAHTSARASL